MSVAAPGAVVNEPAFGVPSPPRDLDTLARAHGDHSTDRSGPSGDQPPPRGAGSTDPRLPTGPRWAAGRVRARGAALPRRRLLGAGRLPRCRGVLRDQRVPHHDPADRGVRPRRRRRSRPVLGPAGAPTLAGAVRPHRGRRRLLGGLRARHRGPATRRHRRRAHLHDQLVPDLLASVLLRGPRTALDVAPLVVVGGRGAVLHRLAARLRRRHRPRRGQGPPPRGTDPAGRARPARC